MIDDRRGEENVFEGGGVKKGVEVYVYGRVVDRGEKGCLYYVMYLGGI